MPARIDGAEVSVLEPTPSILSDELPLVELLSAPAARDAARVLAMHLAERFRERDAVVATVDPHDGHLRGWRALAVGPPAPLDLDPVAVPSALVGVLDADSCVRRSLDPGDPAALEHDRELLAVRLVLPSDRDPGMCPRLDCPERCGRFGVCGAGTLPRGGWTRDRLTCGLLPVVGLVGLVRRAGTAPFGGDDPPHLERRAASVAPIFRGYRFQEAWSDAEYLREDLFDSMSEAILATNHRGDVLFLNRAAEELLGVERHDVLGRPLESVYRERDRRVATPRETLRSGRSVVRVERTLVRPDGREIPVSVTTSPMTARGWGIRGAVLSFVDARARKAMEAEIQHLDRLATLGRFAAAVAHEIRNPLGGISAGVQYLRTTAALDADSADHLRFVEAEIARLDRIVGELGTVTRVRVPSRVPSRLDVLLARAIHAFEPLAAERDVELSATDSDLEFDLDPDHIQQVIHNLVKNAIEACAPGGHVRVACDVGEDESLSVTVTDDGPGMTAEVIAHMFEPFSTTKSAGTGLGLYLCHSLVEGHGGSIAVTSAPGCGTEVTVTLPVPRTDGSST